MALHRPHCVAHRQQATVPVVHNLTHHDRPLPVLLPPGGQVVLPAAVPQPTSANIAQRLRPKCSTAQPEVALSIASSLQPEVPVQEAWDLLTDFTKKEFRGLAQSLVATPEKRSRLRQAILAIYRQPNAVFGWCPGPDAEVLLGVLASEIRIAVRAYRDWCQELGLPFVMPASRVPGVDNIAKVKGTVYLKYNSKTQVCYISQYTGKDRGVLIQLGQVQLGHFPLGLFDEGMKNPPVVLEA